MGISRTRLSRRGFSLVELVIVVVIIAIIASIALPRLSRGNQGAAEAALLADLKVLRQAIDLYYVDHNATWPGYRPAAGDAPHASSAAFERQLAWYTAKDGTADPNPDDTYHLGPYLSAVPALPVGANQGATDVQSLNWLAPTPAENAGYGWEFCHYTGAIRANSADVGSNGVSYHEW